MTASDLPPKRPERHRVLFGRFIEHTRTMQAEIDAAERGEPFPDTLEQALKQKKNQERKP